MRLKNKGKNSKKEIKDLKLKFWLKIVKIIF